MIATARAVAGAMLLACLAACARERAAAPHTAATPPPITGESTAHDFDFELGTWHTHLRRLAHPLSGSTTWVVYDGTSAVRPVWEGRANLVELDVTGPAGHIVGLSVRLFDPQARTWSLNFASAGGGGMAVPAVGGFKNGRGEFYDHEDFGARTILVRSIISDVTPTSYSFEQSFSVDEGKTWEPNWIAVDTRVAPMLVPDDVCTLLTAPDRTADQRERRASVLRIRIPTLLRFAKDPRHSVVASAP